MRLKSIAIVAAAILITGCSNNSSSKDKNTYTVGICQLTQHTALDLATKGFEEALEEKLGGEKVTFDLQVADGSSEQCEIIAEGFVEKKVDLMMANATPALKQCAAATDNIPIVATSITDYGTALNIRKWNGITGQNITGTSDLAPIEEQEKIIKELIPDVKKVGVLYCFLESNSVYQASCMGDALQQDGIEYINLSIRDESELEEVIKYAAGNCDAIYVPTDNVMAKNVDKLKRLLTEYKIPMFAGEEAVCSAGVATLSIDYYNIGYKAGEMAYEILVEGKEAGLMDISYADETTKKYNPDMAKYFGLTVPSDYISIND